jgi:serine kinase of HPr protein (carbohydrate metabolism regulator)
LLSADGCPVLHASAVELEGRTLAIAGQAGAGKSTLAALLCSAGASLVTDDTLRVDPDAPDPICYRGTRSLRLRDPAAQLAEQIEGQVRTTADARTAVVPAPAGEPRLPLAAIVLPVPDRETDELRIDRLGDRQALLALLGCQRVVGWRAEEPIRAQFAASAALAAGVPVLRVTVPWGPPFDPTLVGELLEAAV